MHKNDYITGEDCQTISEDQSALIEARRQVASTLAGLSAEERRSVIQNLYPFDAGDALEAERQKLAAEMRERFRFAIAVDGICWLFGWRFVGFNWVDLAPGTDLDLDRGADLEWLNPHNDNYVVRLEPGDEPTLLVSDNGVDSWREISIDQLGDVLGEWREAEAKRRAA